jgi:hypothetical protein
MCVICDGKINETMISIDCSDCLILTSLKPIRYCKSLERLDCSRCKNLTSLEGIENCKNLKWLKCDECPLFNSLEPLSNCKALETLKCGDTDNLTSFKGLEDCKDLKHLGCFNCPIQDLTYISNLTELEEFGFCSGDFPISIEPLSNCKKLKSLTLVGSILSFEPLSKCTELIELVCHNCLITTIEPLSNCKKLRKIFNVDSFNLTSVDIHNSNLEIICINCPSLTSIVHNGKLKLQNCPWIKHKNPNFHSNIKKLIKLQRNIKQRLFKLRMNKALIFKRLN